MASRTSSRALSSSLRQIRAPRIAQRTFITAVNATRPNALTASKATAACAANQIRGVKTVDFAGDKEEVFGMACQ